MRSRNEIKLLEIRQTLKEQLKALKESDVIDSNLYRFLKRRFNKIQKLLSESPKRTGMLK